MFSLGQISVVQVRRHRVCGHLRCPVEFPYQRLIASKPQWNLLVHKPDRICNASGKSSLKLGTNSSNLLTVCLVFAISANTSCHCPSKTSFVVFSGGMAVGPSLKKSVNYLSSCQTY